MHAAVDDGIEYLDEDSPTAAPPPQFKVTLSAHQLAALHRCRLLEASCLEDVDIKRAGAATSIVTKAGTFLHTRVGILADTVGSGKSFVILALAWESEETEEAAQPGAHTSISSHGCNQVILCAPEARARIRTTVVVVPHALCGQWKGYLVAAGYQAQGVTDARVRRFAVAATTRSVESLFPSAIQACDVVVVSATNYESVVAALAHHRLLVRRFVFDEADTLTITGHVHLARFSWYVTASFTNLMHPLGSAAYYRSAMEGVLESPFRTASPADHSPPAASSATGLRPSTGHTRVMFKDMYETAPPSVVRALVVKCDDGFVERSLRLPPPVHTIVRCRTPHAIRVLDGLVDRSVLEALHAGDEAGALRLVAASSRVVRNDESIMTLTMERVTRQLSNAQCHLDMASGVLLFDSEQERDSVVAVLGRKRDELRDRIASLNARVRDTDTCLVCVDTIRHKTVTPCCANAYCLQCIHTWLERRCTCPICKTPLRAEDLVTVNTGVADSVAATHPGAGRHTHVDKRAALEAVLTRCGVRGTAADGQQPSVLVFSGYDDLLTQAGEVLKKAGMRHASLKGNGATVTSVVTDFRSGETKALLANVRSYGSGLNLENTTDVVLMHRLDPDLERQVVGRAQRPGRTVPLHVWQLLHDSE